MGTIRMEPNAGFIKYWQHTQDAEEAIRTETEKVAAGARSSMPYASVRSGIKVEVGIEDGDLIGRVNSNDYRSHWFEYGTVKMRAHAFMLNGAMAAGYTVKPKKGKSKK